MKIIFCLLRFISKSLSKLLDPSQLQKISNILTLSAHIAETKFLENYQNPQPIQISTEPSSIPQKQVENQKTKSRSKSKSKSKTKSIESSQIENENSKDKLDTNENDISKDNEKDEKDKKENQTMEGFQIESPLQIFEELTMPRTESSIEGKRKLFEEMEDDQRRRYQKSDLPPKKLKFDGDDEPEMILERHENMRDSGIKVRRNLETFFPEVMNFFFFF